MRNDDKLNFGINHTNNLFFPAKCLQVDNKIKSLLSELNTGLDDSKILLTGRSQYHEQKV